jgi:hypothetical protein
MAIEQPVYRVVDQQDNLEIRQYDPYIVAETRVEGAFGDAGNEGFMRLLRYITGANQSRTEIGMTAPVEQRAEGEKIAMTAPVAQVNDGAGHWVSFMMPSQFSLETLPQPTDTRIRLRVVPAQTMAVVRYSGFWSETRYRKEEARLREFMAGRGVAAAGEARFARYNPPFTPPFMRRNEILIPLFAERAAASTRPPSRETPAAPVTRTYALSPSRASG